MKTIYIHLFILAFLPLKGAYSQQRSENRNYWMENTIRREGVTDYMKADSLTISETIKNIRYYDGFGKPMQDVYVGAANGTKDVVLHKHYDKYWRENREYLPYADNGETGGAFRINAEADTKAYYATSSLSGMPATTYPYSEIVLEQSMLERKLEQGAPGEKWQPADKRDTTGGRTVLTEYGTCTASGTYTVKLFKMTGDGVIYESNYQPGSLLKITVKDENWTSGTDGILETYTDLDGNTILERSFHTVNGVTEALDTYYVYDEIGRLRHVLTPQLTDTFRKTGDVCHSSSEAMNKYGYEYRYDERGNCIYKKTPGCEALEMRYDKANRLVLTQDGKQRQKEEWTCYIYDTTGRLIIKGLYDKPDVEIVENNTVTGQFNANGNLGGYECNHVQEQDIRPMKIIYYDNYGFIGNHANNRLIPIDKYGKSSPYPSTENPDGYGMKTGELTYDADGSGTMRGAQSLYYDGEGRVVQRITLNHLGGTDTELTDYTFTGLPEKVVRIHAGKDESRYTETIRYAYDNTDRLLTITHRMDNETEEKICDRMYDGTGNLNADRRNGMAGLKTEYEYNIRGWLTSIKSQLFSQNLHYTDGTGTPCYNGNISSMTWKAGNDGILRGYKFDYDGLDRMKKAQYGEGILIEENTNRFNEEVTGYDKMGNITGLKRCGMIDYSTYGVIDDLAYTYNGNQLRKVEDNATGEGFTDGADTETEYAYDENGNLTKNLNKNIADIQYNYLNLPKSLTFGNGNSITYTYDADGNKLRTVHKVGTETLTTDYTGNVVYENGAAKRLLTEAGYLTLEDGKYHYFIQDHQGNNRVVVDEAGNVEETNHYYPFGELFASSNSIQPYKYNGKELDNRNRLEWYDYGARFYDPTLGRWNAVDPMSEKYYNVSPYVYCMNNPINLIDINGMDWYQNKKTKYYTWYESKSIHKGYFYIGGKGSVLGEFESIIDNILADVFQRESLYSEGFTFDIVPIDKGALIGSTERGWDFLDEFINGTGPEFSVFTSEHPYTEEMKMDSKVIEGQQKIAKGNTDIPGQITAWQGKWNVWNALTTFSLAKQFIGSYRYDAYTSKDGMYLNNIISDSKSMSSFLYHLYPSYLNPHRSQQKMMGTTYQFYIWKSKK